MARRLLNAGYQVVGFDTDEAAIQSFVDAGGGIVQSCQKLADQAEIIFASLPTIQASRAVTLEDASIGCGKAVRIFVETSTVGPSQARVIAEALNARGIAYLDAPVSGGTDGAKNGTLTTIIGGDRTLFEEIEPIFRAMATHIFYCGPRPGDGQLFKVVNNFIVMNSLAVVCQAIAAGVRAGADEGQLLEVINHSTGRNFATTTFFPNVVLPRSSSPPLEMAIKDVELFVELAREQGLNSDCAELVLQQWNAASTNGLNALQWYESLLRT